MIKFNSYKWVRTARVLRKRLRLLSGDLAINWGNHAGYNNMETLNIPEFVRIAVDKLDCLKTLKENDVKTVPFTTSKEEAREWDKIVARTLLRASQGRGIVLCEPDNIVDAPLYTKYLGDNRREYRVHVFNGKVIDYAKRVKNDRGEEESIRNNNHDYHLARHNLERIPSIEKLAIDAVEAIGLDFGAVDIVRDVNDKNYVLEINTAPKLNDEGINIYVEAIKEYLNV